VNAAQTVIETTPSLPDLASAVDLEVVDVELNDVNGGSIRVYIRRRGADPTMFGDATYRRFAVGRVQALRDEEIRLGLDDVTCYADFAFRVERIKRDVVSFIKEKTAEGGTVYVYGASTKGNTLLQYFGLDRSLIAGAAERNPEKWGKVTVGTRMSAVRTASAICSGVIGVSSRLSLASNSSRIRVSIESGSLRVTTMRGFFFTDMCCSHEVVQTSLTRLFDTAVAAWSRRFLRASRCSLRSGRRASGVLVHVFRPL